MRSCKQSNFNCPFKFYVTKTAVFSPPVLHMTLTPIKVENSNNAKSVNVVGVDPEALLFERSPYQTRKALLFTTLGDCIVESLITGCKLLFFV